NRCLVLVDGNIRLERFSLIEVVETAVGILIRQIEPRVAEFMNSRQFFPEARDRADSLSRIHGDGQAARGSTATSVDRTVNDCDDNVILGHISLNSRRSQKLVDC